METSGSEIPVSATVPVNVGVFSDMALRSILVLVVLLVLQLKATAGQRAAYFITNDAAGNNIVSLMIDSKNGLLSSPVLTPTGGKGEQGVLSMQALGSTEAPPGQNTAPADALFSQDSVVVEGNYLFAVNPGSNTLSMFYVHEDDPSHPILVGKPADTLGQFPVAVAYSSKLEIACVLNSGAIAGVTCFCVSKEGLIPLDTSPRSVAAHYNQTTPPAGTPLTASDVLFNPSSTALFAILKGDAPATPGVIYVYPVVEGKVSCEPVISTPAELILAFGSVFLGSDNRLLVSDSAYGASIVDVSASFAITEEKKTVFPNVGNPCWAAYSPKFESVYVTDGLRKNITVMDPKSGAITGYIPFPGTLPGAVDMALDRKWLYVLAVDPAVLVFELDIDVGKIHLVQKINLSSLGSRNAWVGMAVFHSSP